MKKLLLTIPVLFFAFVANAQVFNTSNTLKKGQFSAGFEPGIYTAGNDFSLFLHGGVGIVSGADLGLKIGIGHGDTYIGGDVEFSLGKRFSLTAGAHSAGIFGLDGTALFTFPIKNVADFYTGLDMDILFPPNNDIAVPLWIPFGLQLGMNSNMAFIFEAEVNITDVGTHYIGGGLNFFF